MLLQTRSECHKQSLIHNFIFKFVLIVPRVSFKYFPSSKAWKQFTNSSYSQRVFTAKKLFLKSRCESLCHDEFKRSILRVSLIFLLSFNRILAAKISIATMKKLMLTCWLLLGTLSIISCHRELEVVREWKQLDFAFPNSRIRSEAIQKGLFVPENTFPIDVDVDYHRKKSNHIAFTFI